jgi:hypothetical protein
MPEKEVRNKFGDLVKDPNVAQKVAQKADQERAGEKISNAGTPPTGGVKAGDKSMGDKNRH